MGIDDTGVRADLYKILMYETGGHFKAHQDSEKALGMFGTLVVQLPSSFGGGSFRVRHNGIEQIFHMGTVDSACSTHHHYVAHYADCEHEIEEVTHGHRLVAVYSLIWTERSPPPFALGDSVVRELADCLTEELGDRTLGALLTHEYTKQSLANFGIRALKHSDRALAGAILGASELMKARRLGDELVLHIAKAYRAFGIFDSDVEKEDPTLSFYETAMDASLYELYTVDGRLRGWRTAGLRLYDFKLFRDIVNVRPDEEGEWNAENPHGSGWSREFQTGRTGNEATADVFTRYVLMFCRREVAETGPQTKRYPIDNYDE